ncbi:MAG: hypothetical protein E7A62_00195 [Actinomycetaceae bacterium]|nr:hypothetical protein [Actinomycetaceae bacterium]MDU0969402.1 hypothetical protein [Actinomycetaceae bacterium]
MTQTDTLTASEAADLFTTADRCDVCGAQAWVRAFMRSGQLLFCAHHAREYASALESAQRVEDGRNGMFAEK